MQFRNDSLMIRSSVFPTHYHSHIRKLILLHYVQLIHKTEQSWHDRSRMNVDVSRTQLFYATCKGLIVCKKKFKQTKEKGITKGMRKLIYFLFCSNNQIKSCLKLYAQKNERTVIYKTPFYFRFMINDFLFKDSIKN